MTVTSPSMTFQTFRTSNAGSTNSTNSTIRVGVMAQQAMIRFHR